MAEKLNPSAEAEFETREVKVDDPALSTRTNQRLTEELQEAVGARTVEVPSDRSHPSRGEATEPAAPRLATSNALVLMIGVFSALVVAGIVGTGITGSWWFVLVAIVLDMIGITVIATVVLRMTSITEKPDPALAAAMQQEGVRNPDERFTQIVEEFRHADVVDRGDRSSAVDEDGVIR